MTKLRAITVASIFAIAFGVLLNWPNESPNQSANESGNGAVRPSPAPANPASADADEPGWNIDPPDQTLETAPVRQMLRGTFDVIDTSEMEQQVRFNGQPIAIKERRIGLGPAFRGTASDLLIVSLSSG